MSPALPDALVPHDAGAGQPLHHSPADVRTWIHIKWRRTPPDHVVHRPTPTRHMLEICPDDELATVVPSPCVTCGGPSFGSAVVRSRVRWRGGEFQRTFGLKGACHVHDDRAPWRQCSKHGRDGPAGPGGVLPQAAGGSASSASTLSRMRRTPSTPQSSCGNQGLTQRPSTPQARRGCRLSMNWDMRSRATTVERSSSSSSPPRSAVVLRSVTAEPLQRE